MAQSTTTTYSMPSVLILGAGGNFGPSIMTTLLSRKDSFDRIGILTSPSRVSKFFHLGEQGIEILAGSLVDPQFYKGFDTVISLLGNETMKLQPDIIDVAISAGVTHFYPSEFGGDIGRKPFLTERYFRDKHLTRNHLARRAEELKREGKEFRYTLFMCGIFVEVWVMYEGFGMDAKNKTFTFYGSPENVWSFSSMEYVANCTIASLTLPFINPSPCREIRIPNFNTTLINAITTLQEVQGTTYKLIHSSVAEARKEQEHYREVGDIAKELLANQKVQAGRDDIAIPEPWDNDVFQEIGIERKGLRSCFESMKNKGML